jgi:DNA-binding NarL/FixJ family response regulator
VKLLVAIASEQVRSTLVRELQGRKNIEAIIECGDSASALKQAEESTPDVVLMGVDLQPEDGFETVRKIVATVPGVSAVLVAVNPAPAHFRKALQAGARDLLEVPGQEGPHCCSRGSAEVSKGKRSALQGMAAQIATRRGPRSASVSSSSAPKEAQVRPSWPRTWLQAWPRPASGSPGRSRPAVRDAAIALGLVPQRTIYDLVQGYPEVRHALLRGIHGQHSSD